MCPLTAMCHHTRWGWGGKATEEGGVSGEVRESHTVIYVSSCCYMCPHTTICVLILLYMCPLTAIYVFSYNCICVLILLYMCPLSTIYLPSFYYICFLVLAGGRSGGGSRKVVYH
jgi:hypothetical protein